MNAKMLERKNAKYCVQNPVRLGQSRLDNKVKKNLRFEEWKKKENK